MWGGMIVLAGVLALVAGLVFATKIIEDHEDRTTQLLRGVGARLSALRSKVIPALPATRR
jgi:hypothetical protein